MKCLRLLPTIFYFPVVYSFLSEILVRNRIRPTTRMFVIERMLQENGLGQRLKVIKRQDLPVMAELYDHGCWKLCEILNFELPAKLGLPTKLEVKVKEERMVVELGQVTTIWNASPSLESISHDFHSLFSHQEIEEAMTKLYNFQISRILSARKRSLNKKEVSLLVETIGEDDFMKVQAEKIIRSMLKAGPESVRLVDSESAASFLFHQVSPKSDREGQFQRAVGGFALSQDATLGGKFKRMPCICVKTKNEESDQSLVFINGGWLVVDSNVRDGNEARKFAKRAQERGQLYTSSDVRIVNRLERLAMGDCFGTVDTERKLEVDVREFLNALGFDTTPAGSRNALICIGRWSPDMTSTNVVPWPKDILDAAKKFTIADEARRISLARGDRNLEFRTDLTRLPAVCIDAKTTTFRDDALGLRLRSSTGRQVTSEASQWEVLIHIADVSDIYSTEQTLVDHEVASLLRGAAKSRGVSRYDLPLGPLHLLPPTLLKTLSFTTSKPESSSVDCVPNRSVTLWVYIDERTGRLIEAGLERSLISAPIALTYDEASICLENKNSQHYNAHMAKTIAMLFVIERILGKWRSDYTQSSHAANQREKRLSAREGTEFIRSRGHKLVDMGLELHGVAISKLMKRRNVPIPRASGSGSSRLGRVATAPLRRYVDGMAQFQALSSLCDFGGPSLTLQDCQEINQHMNEIMNQQENLKPLKRKKAH